MAPENITVVKTAENPGGEYLGSMVGAVGLAIFSDTEVVGTIAPMVVTGGGVIVGASGTFILYDYTLSGNKLRSTEGSILIDLPGMAGSLRITEGSHGSRIKVHKKRDFHGYGKIHQHCIKCEDNVITLSGKIMGQFPSDDPE